MTERNAHHLPLIRRTLLKRILKGIAVFLGFVFLGTLGFGWWALESGRAAEAVRQDILSELLERCDVDAEFASLTLDPLNRRVQLFDLRMRHADGGAQILAVEQAQVALRLLPLFYGRYQLHRVALLGPEATIQVADGRILKLPKCVRPPEDGRTMAPIALGVSELTVERGRFELIVDDVFRAELGNIGISLSPGGSGGMALAVGVDDGVITARGRTLPLHRFRLLGHVEGLLIRPRALLLDRVELALARVQAEMSGSIDLLGPVYEGRVKAKGPLAALHDFVDGIPPTSGQAEIDLSISGNAIVPRAVGKVVLLGARVGEYGLGDRAELELAADPTGVVFNRAYVQLGNGEVLAEGKMALNERFDLSVDILTKDVALARILDSVGIAGSWADLAATGQATLTGTLAPLDLLGKFEFDVRDFVVFDQGWDSAKIAGRRPRDVAPAHRMLMIPSVRAKGRWHFDEDAVEFQDATVIAGATAGSCTARIGFGEGTGLHIETQLPSFDFADLGPIAGLPFGGYGSVSGVVSGPYSDISGVGTFELEDITISGIPFGAGTGNVDWQQLVKLDVTSIEGRLGESKFDGRVGVRLEGDIPLQITGQVRSGRIEDLLIPFRLDSRDWGDPRGRFFGKFDLFGPVEHLTGPIDADIEQITIFEETAQKGRFSGRMDQGRLVVESLQLTKYGARIQAYGFVDPNRGDVRLRARTLKATLQDLDVVRSGLPAFDGQMDITLALDGSIHGVTGTVSADFTDVRAGAVKIGSGRVSGPVKGLTTFLTGQVGSIRLDKAEVELKGGLPYVATLLLDTTDVPAIVAGLQGHDDYSGYLTLRADLNGSLVDWPRSSGTVFVEQGRFTTGELTLDTAAPAKLILDRGVLEARRLAINGPRTRLVADGRVGAQIMDLRLSGRVDLGLFELTSPSIEKAGGVLILDAALVGSPDDMNLVGTGRVEGGLLQIRGFVDRATNFSGDLTFSQNSVLVDRSEGRWAGGKVGVAGSLQLERFIPKSVALRISVDGSRPRLPLDSMDVSGVLSGEITWAGPWTRSRISGELDVEQGVVKPKFDWRSLVGRRRVVEVYDPSAEVLDFDVLFRSKTPIRVKNDEADLEANGFVRLTGTNERLGMLGTASVVRGGRVTFLGREYSMESGVVEFRERFRFKTRYDLVLSARACDARISLNLIGSFEEVETIYSSYPEMGQRDIVSCLIRGVKVSDLDQDLASFAGSALLKLSGVDREVKKVLPIDQLDVTTEYSSMSRQYEPRVLIGKDLSFLNRPTRLEYSTSLLRADDQRAAVRMRLTPRLNLQFGWTSSEDVPYGDWGLDLRQRWEW